MNGGFIVLTLPPRLFVSLYQDEIVPQVFVADEDYYSPYQPRWLDNTVGTWTDVDGTFIPDGPLQVNEYHADVSVTSTNQTLDVGFVCEEVTVQHIGGAHPIYMLSQQATVNPGPTGVQILDPGQSLTLIGYPIQYVSVRCATGQSATIRVDAYANL